MMAQRSEHRWSLQRAALVWGAAPALAAALLGWRLSALVGWWALPLGYLLLGLLQAVMLAWTFWSEPA